MKKILLLIAVLTLASGLFCSCDSDFLETRPTSAYDETTVLSTTENLISAVNGMHKNMYRQYNQTQSQSGLGGLNILTDALGEDLVWPAAGNNWFVAQYRWTDHRNKSGSFAYHAYQFYYMLIANANNILAAADGAEGSDAERKIAKGQALAYRAFAHFNLVQLYAVRYSSSAATDLGVPLLVELTAEPQPRATVAEVYAQVEQDLRDAVGYLENYNRGTDKSQMGKATVQGFQARVALAKGDYANAKTYANAARTTFVADGGRLMTGAEYQTDGFNNTSNPEWIWGSRVIDDQTLYFYAFHAYMSYNFGSSNIKGAPKCINSALYANIATTDARHFLWEANPTASNFPLPDATFSRFPYMNRKFAVVNSGSSVADIVYMRLAEMYLIEAEAKAHLGEADAANVLNELIVTRDPNYDAATYAAAAGRTILEEVLIQRRIELWGEGFRFTDLKRLNSPLDRTGANHNATIAVKMQEAAGTINWQFHFPMREENANPFIKENPNP